jgi:hypothetical protein
MPPRTKMSATIMLSGIAVKSPMNEMRRLRPLGRKPGNARCHGLRAGRCPEHAHDERRSSWSRCSRACRVRRSPLHRATLGGPCFGRAGCLEGLARFTDGETAVLWTLVDADGAEETVAVVALDVAGGSEGSPDSADAGTAGAGAAVSVGVVAAFRCLTPATRRASATASPPTTPSTRDRGRALRGWIPGASVGT